MQEDDDYFQDDDALGELPEAELHALEVAATVASTQQQQQQPVHTAQQHQWTTAPQRQVPQLSREDQEARALYLARLQERRQHQQQQHHHQQPQASQQHVYSINPTATATTRTAVTPAPRANNYQPSRQQQQFTHQQRQLQPRKSYYQPTATYITQPTLPSTVVQRQSVITGQSGNEYRDPSRIQETSTIHPPHEEVVDPEQYNAFDQTVELYDAAGPTALAPQETLPGGGAGVVDRYSNNAAKFQEEERRKEQERYEALVEADQTAGAAMGNAEQAEEMAKMKRELLQLRAAKTELEENLKDAQDKVLSRTGEASILRSNLAKTSKEHERVVASLNALHVEEREKHKREIESLQSETERMKTESLFLKREVDDMASRNRALEKKKAIAAAPLAKDLTTTPKKNRIQSFRDGFEDDEIMHSPTKASGGRIRGSPSKAKAKRKRIADSPISQIQLPIFQPSPSPARMDYEVEAEDTGQSTLDDAALDNIFMKDDRFEVYQAITTHKSSLTDPPTLEKLIHFKFPSEDATISSIFLDQMTQLKTTAENSQFSVSVCRVLFSLWGRCVREEYFEPLSIIQTLLYYCLQISQGRTIYTEILDDMADYVMKVVDINGESVVRNIPEKYQPGIDVALSLELLDYLAQGLKFQERSLKRLWKTLRSDFPVMMLNPRQPIPEKRMMLSLIQKSVFHDTYGTLSFDTVEQDKNQWTLLDVVGTLLSDSSVGDEAMPEAEQRIAVLEMRMDCLKFAGCVLTMDDGINKVAVNPYISKLVRRVSDEIDVVYDYKYGARKSIEFINSAIRLLYGVIQMQTAIPLGLTQELMSAPNGVGQKYVVAITRLAFAEEWMHDLGLAEDVVDAARDILENSLTPEEADSLWQMFQGGAE